MALVLASASPRRRELLPALGLPFEVVPSHVDERSPSAAEEPDAARRACALALRKARAVAAGRPDDLVIGADTIVVLDGGQLGKPGDAVEARAMLQALRGRTHEVVTGVAVVAVVAAATPTAGQEPFEAVAAARTAVTMRDYPDAAITAYVARGEPFDKAGGYAVQDELFAPAARVQGCRCAVIGLPLWTLRGMLRQAGLAVLAPGLDVPGPLAPEVASLLAACATCPLRESAPV